MTFVIGNGFYEMVRDFNRDQINDKLASDVLSSMMIHDDYIRWLNDERMLMDLRGKVIRPDSHVSNLPDSVVANVFDSSESILENVSLYL